MLKQLLIEAAITAAGGLALVAALLWWVWLVLPIF
jgi:hypothetical protein